MTSECFKIDAFLRLVVKYPALGSVYAYKHPEYILEKRIENDAMGQPRWIDFDKWGHGASGNETQRWLRKACEFIFSQWQKQQEAARETAATGAQTKA